MTISSKSYHAISGATFILLSLTSFLWGLRRQRRLGHGGLRWRIGFRRCIRFKHGRRGRRIGRRRYIWLRWYIWLRRRGLGCCAGSSREPWIGRNLRHPRKERNLDRYLPLPLPETSASVPRRLRTSQDSR